jgi:hypothetical protein
MLENEWGVIVVAVTADAAGESSKARRLTVVRYRELVAPDCYGHQVMLTCYSRCEPSY